MKTSKSQFAVVVEKRWGWEEIFHNDDDYCGKILVFRNVGDCISMQYHIQKKETWYVAKGSFDFYWIDPKTGTKHVEILKVGDVVTNDPGDMHQLVAREELSKIFEVSTRHGDEDTYRIYMKTPEEHSNNTNTSFIL